jgi:PAS domain S-box-containing protein
VAGTIVTGRAQPGHSSAKAQDVIDLIQESLIICDLEGRIQVWNKASERIYGWSRADVEGRPLEEILGPSPWPCPGRSDHTRRAQSGAREMRRRTAQGAEVIVSAQLCLSYDADGEPLSMVETAVDVTAQRQAEAKAEAGERHYRDIFQAIPAAVWDVDFAEARRVAMSWLSAASATARDFFTARPDAARALMKLTYARDVNEQAMAIFGPCAREDLLGGIDRYWPESSTADFAEWVISTLEGVPYFARETCQRRCDGEEFTALFTASFAPGTLEAGRLVFSIMDYTEVKQSREAARRSEAFYTDMFHASAFSAWHMDARRAWKIFHDLYDRGITDFRAHHEQNPGFVFQVMDGIRVVDVNETTLRLFGARDRNEMVGSSIIPFWHPDRMEPLLGSLEAAFNGIPTFRSLARMRRLDGREIDVLFTRSATTALSNAGQVLLAIVDMTDKVEAQRALAEMQSNFAHAARVSSLGELTASIAHEVNQPLAAITANGEAALLWLSRQEPDLDKVRSLADEMISEARRASDIVGRVRSMASPQVGQQRNLSLRGLVDEALTLMGAQLEKSGVTAVRDLEDPLPAIRGDAVQLQQVIVNLILNALQALGAVADPRIRLRAYGICNEAVLAVEDNGPGIPADILGKLFTSFFTTKRDGMGMGLAICRTIVEAHGGNISVENLHLRGVRFTVRLPASL